MKKIIYLILFLLIISPCCFSENITKLSTQYTITMGKFVYPKMNKEDFSTTKEYNYYKKITKWYDKEKYEKILKKEPNSVPALYGLYREKSDEGLYTESIQILKKLENALNKEDKDIAKSLLVIEHYKNKDYKIAINEYKLLTKNKQDTFAYVADCYFNIGDYVNANKYASLVKSGNQTYYLAQEVKYKVYCEKKDFNNAKIIAKNLISLKPDLPDSYLRMAEIEDNINIKIKYLYEARNHASETEQKNSINLEIIKYEQKRLENYYNSSKTFVERVNWNSIVENAPKYENTEYWAKRQDEFFKSCNICMTKYQGEEAYKCFKSVRENQTDLTQQLNFIVEQESEAEYRRQYMMNTYTQLRHQETMIRNQQNEIDNIRLQNYMLERQKYNID